MHNVQMKVETNILTITVDLSKHQGLSKSGKSVIIATTEGFAPLASHPGVAVGLNVVTKTQRA